MYVLALGFGNMTLGWVISGSNQAANVIANKLNWSDEKTIYYNSLINTCSNMGAGIGSIAGGIIIHKLGRRKTLMIFNVLTIIATFF